MWKEQFFGFGFGGSGRFLDGVLSQVRLLIVFVSGLRADVALLAIHFLSLPPVPLLLSSQCQFYRFVLPPHRCSVLRAPEFISEYAEVIHPFYPSVSCVGLQFPMTPPIIHSSARTRSLSVRNLPFPVTLPSFRPTDLFEATQPCDPYGLLPLRFSRSSGVMRPPSPSVLMLMLDSLWESFVHAIVWDETSASVSPTTNDC